MAAIATRLIAALPSASNLRHLRDLRETAYSGCHVTNAVRPLLTIGNSEHSLTVMNVVTGQHSQCSVSHIDTDRDGMPDVWELAAGLCPTNAADAVTDADQDGLINLHEWQTGSNPIVPDGSNTLLSVCARSIDDRIRGRNPAASLPLLTNYMANAARGIFVRNPDSWLADVDLSCMAVWNNRGDPNRRAPVAVSSNHVMFAKHFTLEVGKKIWFIDRNGDVITNSIAALRDVEFVGYTASDIDVTVGLLTSPLPNTVSIAKLFPSNVCDKIGTAKYMPVIQVNQEKEARVAEVVELNRAQARHSVYTSSVLPWRQDFAKAIRGGDSGSPTFALVDNEVVLMGLHHTVMTDPSYWAMIDEIQGVMDELSADRGGQLQFIDLSDYPDL